MSKPITGTGAQFKKRMIYGPMGGTLLTFHWMENSCLMQSEITQANESRQRNKVGQ